MTYEEYYKVHFADPIGNRREAAKILREVADAVEVGHLHEVPGMDLAFAVCEAITRYSEYDPWEEFQEVYEELKTYYEKK